MIKMIINIILIYKDNKFLRGLIIIYYNVKIYEFKVFENKTKKSYIDI